MHGLWHMLWCAGLCSVWIAVSVARAACDVMHHACAAGGVGMRMPCMHAYSESSASMWMPCLHAPQAVLACDVERTQLLEEEASILSKLNKDKTKDQDKASTTAQEPSDTPQTQAQPPKPAAAKSAPLSKGSRNSSATQIASDKSQGVAKGQEPEQAQSGSQQGGAEDEAKLSARLVDIYARLEEIDAYGTCLWHSCVKPCYLSRHGSCSVPDTMQFLNQTRAEMTHGLHWSTCVLASAVMLER